MKDDLCHPFHKFSHNFFEGNVKYVYLRKLYTKAVHSDPKSESDYDPIRYEVGSDLPRLIRIRIGIIFEPFGSGRITK